MKKNTINICLCTKDDYYIKYTASLLTSLSNHKKMDYLYNIYILGGEISTNTQNNLNGIDKDFCIKYFSFNENAIFEKYNNIPKKDYIYLYRLFLGDYIKDVNKIIYMDNDIIINGDISELFNIDLGDKIVGASLDCINRSLYAKHKLAQYFNSGVLLIDIHKRNFEDIGHRVLQVINDRKDEFWKGQDQDGLNYILDGKWKSISPKWNGIRYNSLSNKGSQYSKQEFYELNHPIICHFAGTHNRPRGGVICMHPKRYLYYKYIFKTKYWEKSDVYKLIIRIFTSNIITRYIYKILRYFFSDIALNKKYKKIT